MSDVTVPSEFILATAKQSQLVDAATIADFGIEGFTLMEIAGYSTAMHLLKDFTEDNHGIFLCGKGNNAGDALVVARYLIQHGIKATIVFLSGIDDLSDNTQKNLQLLKAIDEKDASAAELTIIPSWNNFDIHTKANFIIDGLLGTGLSSNLRGDYIKAVEWCNESELPVFAIDIPTGLHADSGEIMGSAIQTQKTFTYGIQKQGLYLNEGYACSGKIIFCELPFPNFLKQDCNTFLIDDKWIKPDARNLPKHKYEGGVLYVIAGSKGLTGAAIMAAKSAWNEGLGAVILITPQGNLMPYEENLPQIIKKTVGKDRDLHFKMDHLEETLNIVQEKNGAVLIGPGLGRDNDTVSFVQSFLKKFEGKVVLDADALFALSKMDEIQRPEKSDWILTPHPGELSTLLKLNETKDPGRIQAVQEFAQSKKITLVSKGFPVVVGTKDGNAYLTSYDTRQFSRAGFGDVLAGKISAYWALKNNALKSAALGLLNGKDKMETLGTENPTYTPEPADLI
ncbi:MAG: NAD(P)H-hydrate dehydratase [Balneolaceae bacterium]|nr:NAD(P)H-hydrate dehydratase [Balneolaceae bacterium]